jgi:2-oxoglutarate ferredoxin oxidoreductase subunit beta
MDLTVILHDNRIYGLTKKQASPTSPIGTKSNTTPKGSYLDALNPLTVSLGVANVSFVAQVVDWIPEVVYQVISAAYKHKGLSFVRVLQRCPEFMPGLFDPWMQDPQKTQLLRHPDFVTPSAELSRTYRNQLEHDPRDIDAARRVASMEDPIPVGILYQNDDVPCYEDTRHASALRTPDQVKRGLDAEFDKFTIWPDGGPANA